MAWTWHSVEAKGDLNWLNEENQAVRRCRIVNVVGKPLDVAVARRKLGLGVVGDTIPYSTGLGGSV
ncbi:hypothetical protein CDO26_05760 [Sinorhizobium meliloti]|uniref:hypothetical protein n=1 Tax=Rhizobium meliloti TaxID=382 RepID=UPI00047FF610|nr:hypothetical protein [Sinorhizobium meliloti]ASP84157.1 hypothetical protein CDO26_05760 [Sinorhizobium meliloti]MDE4621726.1 hypothetical protein [Sinorhizobium meliloti]MQW25743.1 hypothetical protein [Sinorhizobium meliloti]